MIAPAKPNERHEIIQGLAKARLLLEKTGSSDNSIRPELISVIGHIKSEVEKLTADSVDGGVTFIPNASTTGDQSNLISWYIGSRLWPNRSSLVRLTEFSAKLFFSNSRFLYP